mgnify:CR=1 FL=1
MTITLSDYRTVQGIQVPFLMEIAPEGMPEPIRLRIDAGGTIYWNDSPTPVTALRQMMDAEVQRDVTNQPTLEIDMSEDAEYGVLAKVLASAKNAHMQKIGFVKK